MVMATLPVMLPDGLAAGLRESGYSRSRWRITAGFAGRMGQR